MDFGYHKPQEEKIVKKKLIERVRHKIRIIHMDISGLILWLILHVWEHTSCRRIWSGFAD